MDSIDIDYHNLEMHEIDSINDHTFYGHSTVNQEKVADSLSNQQNTATPGKWFYRYV